MDKRFGTWNVRSLYRSGSLKTVSGELAKYKLHFVGVQEVRWDKGGTEPAGAEEQTKFGECLLPCSSESFVFLSGV
jgi:hypothetical protein